MSTKKKKNVNKKLKSKSKLILKHYKYLIIIFQNKVKNWIKVKYYLVPKHVF